MKRRAYEILFEDEHLLVLDKSAGLLSIPDRYDPEKENLLDLLRRKWEDIRVLHRLDRDTSGLICFAKTELAHKEVSRQFEQRTVQKYYYALLDGNPSAESGTIDKALAASPKGKMLVVKKGKEALTHFTILERFKNFCWAEVEIKTGRTHQIRVHFEAIGHPLAVDSLYGRRSELYLSTFKGRKFRMGKEQEEQPLLRRTSLHAHSLQFVHPVSGESLQLEAPIPKDLKASLHQLRKWAAIQI